MINFRIFMLACHLKSLFLRSATLTPDMFNNVLDRLGFRPERIAICLSNNHTNIYLNVREMEHAVGSYKDLRLPSLAKSTLDIVRTIIYFDK
jgi:hypothetical protein